MVRCLTSFANGYEDNFVKTMIDHSLYNPNGNGFNAVPILCLQLIRNTSVLNVPL